MPRLLMDSESDEEFDEPSTSAEKKVWDSGSSNGTPSVSSFFSYTNYVPFQPPVNPNFVMVPGYLPPNPFSANPCPPYPNQSTKDSNQCMFFMMPVCKDVMSNKCNFPATVKPENFNSSLQSPSTPKSGSLSKRMKLPVKYSPMTRSSFKKEESDNDEAEVHPRRMGLRKLRRRGEKEGAIKMPFVKLARIDEVYSIIGRTVSLKNLKRLPRSESLAKTQSNLKSDKSTVFTRSKVSSGRQAFSAKYTSASVSEKNKESFMRTRRGKYAMKNRMFASKMGNEEALRRGNEWSVRRSVRNSKPLVNPIPIKIRHQPQRKNALLQSSKSEDSAPGMSSRGLQNDSKLIISVVKVLNSSGENKEKEPEKKLEKAESSTSNVSMSESQKDRKARLEMTRPIFRRRRGRKRKRVFTVTKKHRVVKQKDANEAFDKDEIFNHFEEVDTEYENEAETRMHGKELKENEPAEKLLENVSREDETSRTQKVAQEPDARENAPTLVEKSQLEKDGLQKNQKKKRDKKPMELSLADKIKCDMLKDLQIKSMTPVQFGGDGQPTSDVGSVSNIMKKKETLPESMNSEKTKTLSKNIAPKISILKSRDRRENSVGSEPEVKLDIVEQSVFDNIKDMLVEMDKEEASSTQGVKSVSRRSRKQDVVSRDMSIKRKNNEDGSEIKFFNPIPNPTICVNCKKVQRVLHELARLADMRILEEGGLKCPLCHKNFISMSYTRLHLEINHFVCKRNIKCKMDENNVYSLSKRKQTNTYFRCNYCTKLFGSINYVQMHMHTAHGKSVQEKSKGNVEFPKMTNGNFEESKKDDSFPSSSAFDKNAANGYQKLRVKNTVARLCSVCNEIYQAMDSSKFDHSYANPRKSSTYTCPDCAQKVNRVAKVAEKLETFKSEDKEASDFKRAHPQLGKVNKKVRVAKKLETTVKEVDKTALDLKKLCPQLEKSGSISILKVTEETTKKTLDLVNKENDRASSLLQQVDILKSNKTNLTNVNAPEHADDQAELDISEFIRFDVPKKVYGGKREVELLKRNNASAVGDLAKKIKTQEDTSDVVIIRPIQQQYFCRLCPKKFDSRRPYSEHMFFFHDEAMEDSVVADLLKPTSSTSEKNQDDECKSEEEPMFVCCKECSLDFLTNDVLAMHRFTVHDEQSSVHVCENCGKILTSVASVNTHECINIKSFDCEQCKKTFSSSLKLSSHNMMYHFEKDEPHGCTDCKKLFLTNRMLKKHYRISHSGSTDPGVSTTPSMDVTENDSNADSLISLHVIPIRCNSSLDNQYKKLDLIIRCIEYERISKVILENYEMNQCKTIDKPRPNKSKYCYLCDHFMSTPTLMNHWNQAHQDIGEICHLCGGLYQKVKEVVHMLHHHINSSAQGLKINPKITFLEEVDNFIKLMGSKRLLSIFLYHMIQKQFQHSEQKKCIVCTQTFPDAKSCKVHFAVNHDRMCILCNLVFASSKLATQHKKKYHKSFNSYLWFIHRAILHITDALSIDPGLSLEEMLCKILVRYHDVSVSNIALEDRAERLRSILSPTKVERLLASIIEVNDENSDTPVLIVTESDFIQYKNNIPEFASRMKQNIDFLSLDEIIISLDEYYQSKEQ